ncbi:MAG: glycosyltransferase [Gammaproteobacteria bacterium]|jgi:glycosyltransferase involved in cell wall biosynthesis|nr:glycosyltransferase [Gammaproteobacteria bacterium]
MRILHLTEEAPFSPDSPASGNQLRADRLQRGLSAAGISVVHRWHEDWNADRMAECIGEERPDCLMLGYWQLAESLPVDCPVPVIADCIAPRPLEAHFVDPLATGRYIQRYIAALDRTDLMLVGNDRQRSLLGAWLLAAGDDLRRSVPIVEVPMPVEPPERARDDHALPLILATGGRQWPWRVTEGWLEALLPADRRDGIELHHFGSRPAQAEATEHGLASWQDWQRFLGQRAHVGVELADANFERQLAQPFRIASFLEAGLPLLVNDCLPIAEPVRELDAGWAVESPARARAAVIEALEDPGRWRRKAAGARRLALEFDAEPCLRPLLHWLESPRKRSVRRGTAPVPGSRPAVERGPSLTGMLARSLLKPIRREVEGEGVVIVSRSDLFPTDHGAAVKIVETARGLAAGGRPVAVVTADRGRYWAVEDGRFVARSLPAWLRLLALPEFVSQLMHKLRGLPESNAFLYWPLYDPGYGLRAAWVGRRIGASVALAEFPAFAQAARICRLLNAGRAVLAEHNVEYLRLAEQIDGLADRAYETLKRGEIGLGNNMDAVVCVSDRDRSQLIADGLEPYRSVTIPHGVDLTAFEAAVGADLAGDFGLDSRRPVLAYHGTFSYPPNRQALMVLLEELLPRLHGMGHAVQLLAIGSEAPVAVDHPDVRLPGSLPDLAAPLKACDLAVVPLVSGGGTRMKILDYFAAGLPVVSTTKGCEGLPVEDGRQLLIRDDWDAFAQAVAELLEDDQRRQALGEAGHELARSLSWQEIAGRYDRLFRKLT